MTTAAQKAIVITTAGGPEVLQLQEVDTPTPGDNELCIEVAFAGVNRHDCNQRRRGPVPTQSVIPGLEVSGVVRGLGRRVRGFEIGQRVCALVDGGGYAQFACAPASHAFLLGESISLEQAAALPEAMFTIWHNFFGVARLGPGETVLIHGGTSGVGSLAIPLLRRLGHRVFATSGSGGKCEKAASLGASAINYRTQDFVEVVAAATSGRGVDVILDMVGGDYGPRNVEALAQGGRIVHLSPGDGAEFRAPLRTIMAKQACITGSLLRPLPAAAKDLIAESLRRVVWPMVVSGELRPLVDGVLDLSDATQAHRRLEAGGAAGKLVLRAPR